MGKASKITAPTWLADRLLSAMNFDGTPRDASFDFLRAVEPTSRRLGINDPKLNNE